MFPRRLVWYMNAVDVLGAAVLALSLPSLVGHLSWPALTFTMLALASSLFAISLLRGHGSVSTEIAVVVGASIVLGPAVGCWVAALGTITGRQLSGKVALRSVLFNRFQYALVGYVSGALFQALGGVAANLSIMHFSGALVWAIVAGMGINVSSVAIAIALRQNRPILQTLRVHFQWLLPGYCITVPLAYSIAAMFPQVGIGPEVLVLVPLVATRYLYTVVAAMRRMYHRTIQTILAGLRAKDLYTFGHSVRVGEYAMVLAEYLRLPEDVVEQIKHAGMLHDIGKVCTPEAVLNKPGRLEGGELLVMREHPTAGAELLAQGPIVAGPRDGVLYHHERWDGTGYPKGLKGEEIPVTARIISVVDAYDAMTTDRPYRPHLSHDCAIRELAGMAGSQFDPRVVAAFLEMQDRVRVMAEEFQSQAVPAMAQPDTARVLSP